MSLIEKAKNFGLVKIVIGIILIALLIAYIFREQIKEHKVTRAKIELFKRMTHSKPDTWDNEFRQIFDSMIMEKVDTI